MGIIQIPAPKNGQVIMSKGTKDEKLIISTQAASHGSYLFLGTLYPPGPGIFSVYGEIVVGAATSLTSLTLNIFLAPAANLRGAGTVSTTSSPNVRPAASLEDYYASSNYPLDNTVPVGTVLSSPNTGRMLNVISLSESSPLVGTTYSGTSNPLSLVDPMPIFVIGQASWGGSSISGVQMKNVKIQYSEV